jgi:hypothetical protein
MTDRDRIAALVVQWREVAKRVRKTQGNGLGEVEALTYDTCADELAALLRAEDARPQVDRELLVRADSYLSLLWHRHVPAERKDVDLQVNVERTIGELRAASKREASR